MIPNGASRPANPQAECRRTLFSWDVHLARCSLFSRFSRIAARICSSSVEGGGSLSPRAAVLRFGGWALVSSFFGDGVGAGAVQVQPCDAAVGLLAENAGGFAGRGLLDAGSICAGAGAWCLWPVDAAVGLFAAAGMREADATGDGAGSAASDRENACPWDALVGFAATEGTREAEAAGGGAGSAATDRENACPWDALVGFAMAGTREADAAGTGTGTGAGTGDGAGSADSCREGVCPWDAVVDLFAAEGTRIALPRALTGADAAGAAVVSFAASTVGVAFAAFVLFA